MKTTEEIFNDNSALRATLEARSKGCTARVPAVSLAGFSHEAVCAEATALAAIRDALGSVSSVKARGAAVAASYAPTSTVTTTDRVTAAGGAKAFNLKSEISKLEKLSVGFAKGSASARATQARITNLRTELAKVTAGK